MTRFGVDEAGKGPVLGSMIAAAVFVTDRSILPDGIADSKRLSPARRESLATTLRERDEIAVGVAEITTDRIDDPDTDMNSLTVEAHARALESAAQAGASVSDNTSVHCDACDTDADRFARRVADACSFELPVEATHGADDEDPLVGAASIIAKVERDAHVSALGEAYGEVGSGYPSDPTTRTFLETYVDTHGELPPCARRSWSTCDDVLAAAEQTSLEGF